jgi:hypothetical protein
MRTGRTGEIAIKSHPAAEDCLMFGIDDELCGQKVVDDRICQSMLTRIWPRAAPAGWAPVWALT